MGRVKRGWGVVAAGGGRVGKENGGRVGRVGGGAAGAPAAAAGKAGNWKPGWNWKG